MCVQRECKCVSPVMDWPSVQGVPHLWPVTDLGVWGWIENVLSLLYFLCSISDMLMKG